MNNKKALLTILVLAAFPLTGQALDKNTFGVQESSSENISISGDYYAGIYNQENKEIEFSGKKISVDINSQSLSTGYGIWSRGNIGSSGNKPVIKLGGSLTEDINVKVTGENVVTGIRATVGGTMDVVSNKLNVNVKSENDWAYGVQVQGNNQAESSLIINAENTVINVTAGKPEKASGIVVFSGSSLNVNGNLTVNAYDAIVTSIT